MDLTAPTAEASADRTGVGPQDLLMRLRERRESKRVNYLCECQVEPEGLSTNNVTARINDLSVEGLFIDSMSWLPIGTTLKLKFKIREREIQATGEVRYFVRNVGTGVRFLGLTPKDREIVESAVNDKPLADHRAVTEPTPALPSSTATAAGDGRTAGPVMAGDLAAISLFDVIDMIESSRLTGRLTVSAGGVNSEIHFNDGVIVGASDASAVGIAAFNRILGSLGEAFEFHESDTRFQPTIRSSSNTSLILEMLIHKDEETLDRTLVTPQA